MHFTVIPATDESAVFQFFIWLRTHGVSLGIQYNYSMIETLNTRQCRVTVVRKYSKTFYVGIGQAQNGPLLYLRYGSSSVTTIAKCNETVTDKSPWLYYCKMSQEISYHTQKLRKTNMKFQFYYPFFFFFLLQHTQLKNYSVYINVLC